MISPGMPVSQLYHLPDIHPAFLGNLGKLISQGDVYIPEGILDEFHHLGRPEAG